MGLIDRLAGEPNYDEMPDPEPPLPCFVCGGVADHEFRDTGSVDYGVCHAHRGHEPLVQTDVSWDRPLLNLPPVLHQWASAEPKLKVKLESHGDPKTDRFYRTWEVSYEGADPQAVLAMLAQVDDHLQARYGGLP